MSTLSWQVARASGIVAWALVTASVVWGLLLSTRILAAAGRPRWLTDLHRFLGGLSIVFVGVHLGGLALDRHTPFGLTDLLVPLASSWRPVPVALGIVALYALGAVELTSLAMARVPRRLWRVVHLTSFGVFWLSTVHGVAAGHDVGNPLMWWSYTAAAALVLFLTVHRVLLPRRAGRMA